MSVVSLWLAGCSSVTVEGRLVDGLTAQPIAGPFGIKAKAVSKDAAITCQFLEGEVGADGAFSIGGLCRGTAYTLELAPDDLWLGEGGEVPDGGWETPAELKVWRAPKGPGLYRLSGGELDLLKTDAEVQSEKIWGSDQRVRYPGRIPTAVPLVGPDDHLVEVGDAVDKLQIWPLVPSAARKFGDPAVTWTMEPWVYVGTTFTDDATFTVAKAEVDAGRVVDLTAGDRKVRFVSGSAVAPGRYAILADEDLRMYIVDFGAAQAPPPGTPDAGDGGKTGKGKGSKGG